MPSAPPCSRYHTAVNPEFGSLDDFKALVKQAHGMGMHGVQGAGRADGHAADYQIDTRK
ncbi:hypothetical protein NX773_11955 [Massilia solisilvae]|uniref:Uncharacterized protein n=1 Tax=Massilia solisilvae TaxID=1811225 RepID=A0ABT2BK41_9BURK|nr:hypothetical protein [Massilia solisilvae]MCS0608878.1 hypothetical protein [Massilia solisilvae]